MSYIKHNNNLFSVQLQDIKRATTIIHSQKNFFIDYPARRQTVVVALMYHR